MVDAFSLSIFIAILVSVSATTLTVVSGVNILRSNTVNLTHFKVGLSFAGIAAAYLFFTELTTQGLSDVVVSSYTALTGLFTHNVLVALSICILAAAATMLGSLSVVTARKADPRILAFGLAFAGGAMVYISLVEIFWKSLSSFSEVFGDKEAYSYATVAFFLGVAFIALVDRLIPNPHNDLEVSDNVVSEQANKRKLKRLGLLAALAITAHNFPEGMATFFAALEDPVLGSSLAFAIAVHNIPEGVSIAVPVYYATNSMRMTFLACLISALAEPVGAMLGFLVLAPFLSPMVFGAVFGVIAGTMVFLALDELLPTAKRYSSGHDAVYGMVIGMGCVALSLVLFR